MEIEAPEEGYEEDYEGTLIEFDFQGQEVNNFMVAFDFGGGEEGATVGSQCQAQDNMQARTMGKISPGVVTNTPAVDSRPWNEQYRQGTYLNNGGADGSLVFAMHQNRHG